MSQISTEEMTPDRCTASKLAGRIKQSLDAGARPSLADGYLSDDELLVIYRALKLFPVPAVSA